MKKQMVGNVPGNVLGMLADLSLKIQNGTMTPKQLEMFLKGENPFENLDYSIILNDWEKFFYKIYGLKVDFAGVRIPEADDNAFPWFSCLPENFSTERVFSEGKKLYSQSKWIDESLDDVLDLSFGRDSQKDPYIVRFHANWEADKALKNLSADYKRHLDVKNITLCAGSRFSDGSVPLVRWHPDLLSVYVDWCSSGYACSFLRARKVVS